jgi:hypothetical protein
MPNRRMKLMATVAILTGATLCHAQWCTTPLLQWDQGVDAGGDLPRFLVRAGPELFVIGDFDIDIPGRGSAINAIRFSGTEAWPINLTGAADAACSWRGTPVIAVGGNNLSQWNGTSFAPLPSPPVGWVSGITTLIEFDGELIAGGSGGVAAFDGTNWRVLPSLHRFAVVSSLVVWNGELVAAGNPLLDASSVGVLRGSQWLPIGNNLWFQTSPPRYGDLAVHNGELFISGNYFIDGDYLQAARVARWSGTRWEVFGNPAPQGAVSLASYRGELIAAGGFINLHPYLRTVSRWSGSQWSEVCGFNTSLSVMAQSAGPDSWEVLVWGERGGSPPTTLYSAVSLPVRIERRTVPIVACATSPIEFTAHSAGSRPLEYAWSFRCSPLDPWTPLTTGPVECGGARIALTHELTPVSDRLSAFVEQAGDAQIELRVRVTNDSSEDEADFVLTLCAADRNCDGTVDGDDVISFMGPWDNSLPDGDFNRDGAVDGDDVIAFFMAWDSGCTQ